MTIGGNYTLNGTLTFSTGTQIFTFTGSNKIISGSGTINFETINVSIGASLTASNAFTIVSGFTGTITGSLSTEAVISNNGSMKIDGIFQLNSGEGVLNFV